MNLQYLTPVASARSRQDHLAAVFPLVMSIAAAMTLGGCTTKPGPAPRAGFSPAELGPLAVTTFANTSRVYLQVPEDKRSIAAEPIHFEVVTPRQFAIDTAVPASAWMLPPYGAVAVAGVCLAAPVAVMVASPVAQEARKIYGIAVTNTAAEVDAAIRTLTPLCRVASLEEKLQAEVLRQLTQERVTASPHTLAPTAPAVARTKRPFTAAGRPAPVATTSEEERSYGPLASRGIATVLEIKLLEPALRGADGMNPALLFGLHVRVRLIDTLTGAMPHYDYLEYASERRPFVAWAADDAQLFRQGISSGIHAMSTEIVAQLLGPRHHVAADAQLATAGLYRRVRGDKRSPAGAPVPLAVDAPRYAGLTR